MSLSVVDTKTKKWTAYMRENYKGQRFLHFLIMTHIDNVSLIKNFSVFEILELRHETSQVAASQCEVCGGSVETPAHVVDFWKIDTL